MVLTRRQTKLRNTLWQRLPAQVQQAIFAMRFGAYRMVPHRILPQLNVKRIQPLLRTSPDHVFFVCFLPQLISRETFLVRSPRRRRLVTFHKTVLFHKHIRDDRVQYSQETRLSVKPSKQRPCVGMSMIIVQDATHNMMLHAHQFHARERRHLGDVF